MRRAALRTAIHIALLGIGVGLMLTTESIAASIQVHAASPSKVWGYEVRRTADAKAPHLRSLKASHVNTVFGDASVLGEKGVVTARKAAAPAGLPFFQLVHPTGRGTAVTCASHCVLLAANVQSALASANAHPTRPVAVRIAAPGQVARLASLRRGRLIVFVRLSTITPANEYAWRSALEIVKKNPALGIAFSPVGRTSQARVSAEQSVLNVLHDVIIGVGRTPGFAANHVAATSAGSMSHLTSGTKLAINRRTDYPKHSKLTVASALLENSVCGAFGSATVIAGTASRTVVSGRCYRLVLTGRRKSGVIASVSTTVEVDTDAPSGGAFAANGVAATAAGSVSYVASGSTLAINNRTDFTDSGGSGLAASTLTVASATLTSGACGAFGSATAIAGTASQTVASGKCYRLVLTGTDNGGLTASVMTTVEVDTSAPTGGALTANGVAATAAGSVSYVATGTTLAINSRTDFTDSGSGLAGSTLTVASATLTSGACGAFGSATAIAGTASQTVVSGKCYRLVLTGTDNGGLTASVMTTVKVDTDAPTGSIIAPGNGNTVSGAVSVTGTASDAGNSGIASVQFRVDGSNLGSADTTSPYSVNWDTTTVTNAQHKLDAIVTDNAGNQTTIAGVTVTADNSGGVTYQRFMSPTGTDSGTCSTPGTACASFWYTYQQASPGDNVNVAAGKYALANVVTSTGTDSEVLLKYDATKVGGSPVHFYGQGGPHGTQVDLGSTSTVNNSPDITGAQNVILDNIDFLNGSLGVIPQNASSCGVNANGVTLENLYLNGALSTRNAQNLTVKNVDIGNYSLPDGGTQDAWGDSSRIGDYTCPTNAANVVFDHVRFHNIYRGDSPSHAECLFIEASSGVTIEGSRFDGCPIMGIFFKNDGGVGGVSNYQNNVLVENNFITQPCPDYTGAAAAGVPIGGGINNGNQTDCGGHAIQESDCDNNSSNGAPATPMSWVIRFNSFSPNASIWICEPQADWAATSKLYGNVAGKLTGGTGGSSTCNAGAPPSSLGNWHVAYNVWTDPTAALCSASDQLSTGSAEFQSPLGVLTYDYHLIPGAGPKAQHLVPTSEGCPATDIDGDSRPGTPGFCDAGADEG